MKNEKKLYRSRKDRMLGGVCAGFAEYMGTDPTIVRLSWVVLSLIYGFGLLAYIVAWLIMPLEPEKKKAKEE